MTAPAFPWALSASEIRLLHRTAILEHSGADGEREPGRIDGASDTALNAAFYVAGDEAEPNHLVYLAHLLRVLVCDHLFVDGNKRVGWKAVTASLAKERLRVDASQDEAASFVERLAAGHQQGNAPMSANEIASWLAVRIVAE